MSHMFHNMFTVSCFNASRQFELTLSFGKMGILALGSSVRHASEQKWYNRAEDWREKSHWVSKEGAVKYPKPLVVTNKMADWTKWDESSEAKPLFVGTSRKGYHETPRKANTWLTISTLFEVCAEKLSTQNQPYHAIMLLFTSCELEPYLDFPKLWYPTYFAHDCFISELRDKKIVVQNLAEGCELGGKKNMTVTQIQSFTIYFYPSTSTTFEHIKCNWHCIRYTKIKRLEKLWSCI